VPCSSSLLLPLVLAGAPVSPTAFGRVFEDNRASLSIVRTSPDSASFITGFAIGVGGEVVFWSATEPPASLGLEFDDGPRVGTLALWDPATKLALARASAPFPPALRAGRSAKLRREQWVVILSHDAAGTPTSHAGVITALGETLSVEAPGVAGAPVLDLGGRLVALVISGNRRRSRLMPIDRVARALDAARSRGGGAAGPR